MKTIWLTAVFSALAAAQMAGLGASPGSLYTPSGTLADSLRDLRAASRDDIVTIVVNENASAVASGATNTARKSSANASITALAGTLSAGGPLANLIGLSNNQALQGTGQTSRNLTLTTTISTRVVDVTANGTLVVEGTKDISVNSERQTITIRGLIRPADLTTANTVLSTQVADLQLHVTGKGVVNDAVKRPFFLYRILMGLLPL